MSSDEWQCKRCLTYFCTSIGECTECNEYDKHGFNGYYNDIAMNIKTYKWIKCLEAQNKLLTKSNDFYADQNTSWECSQVVPQDRESFFYSGCAYKNCGGKLARETRQQVKELEK